VTWLGRLLRRRQLEDELDLELRDHFERLVADNLARGMSGAEARRRARLDFGGLEQTKEYCRDARGTRLVEDLVRDLGYSARLLRRSPAFTLVAIASLALGIGANTAIFTLVDALVLRALPVREPGRLVRLEGGSWTNPIWEQIRDRQERLGVEAAAFSETRFDLASGGETDFAQGLYVSGGFFDVMGVPAILGRTLDRRDDLRGGAEGGPAAVISYAFWQRRFGGAGDAVGRVLTLAGVPFTIVGVTPPGFFGPTVGRSFDVVIPIASAERLHEGGAFGNPLESRATWWLEILARLGSDATTDSVTAALRAAQPGIRAATLPTDWRSEDLERYLRDPLTLVPAATGFSSVRGEFEGPLLALMAVVVLVLLIACANLASLQLARASARQQELSARLALGAGPWRLARQLLSESLLLAVPGALLGLLLARTASRLLVSQITVRQEALSLDVSLHWRVLLFTAAVTLGTLLLFGLAPALRARHVSPLDAIQRRGRSVRGPGALDRPLVAAQVALSLVLVFGAGLFLRTFAQLSGRDLGIDTAPVLLVDVDTQRSPQAEGSGRGELFSRVQEAAASLPAVEHAALSIIPPIRGVGWNGRFEMPEGTPHEGRDQLSWINAVTPGYFSTYGMTVVAGRDFDTRDRAGAPPVAIVNRAFARHFCDCPDPVGRRVLRQMPGGSQEPVAVEVVGLVGDAAYNSPRDAMQPTVYLPMGQVELWPSATLAVRAATGSPALLIRDVAAALEATDPRLSMTFRPLAGQIDGLLMRERLVAWLSAGFGALALLLACMGLYGVTAYTVGGRRGEIGIRMAIGADPRRIVAMVLQDVGLVLALGIAAGVGIGLWTSRYLGPLLFELRPRDPVTLLGAVILLAAVGLLTAALPARDAARIDPAVVLRES